MTLSVAVDFGSSSTCVAIAVDDEQPRVVVIDASPLMPSAVYADGHTLFVGAEAQRQAALDPSRYEPTPKRRIDEGSLLLGDTVVPVVRIVAAVLSRAVREARNTVGGLVVDVLVLTHPAEWGAVRIAVLRAAASGLAAVVQTVPEPVAAAMQYGSDSSDGAVLAVLDVGAGTTDVSVLRAELGGFRVLGSRGDPHFGGADIDELLIAELGAQLPAEQREAWEVLTRGKGLADRRGRRVLQADVRGAKESLSRHPYADVPLPGHLPDGHLTRAELERLIAPQLVVVAGMLRSALQDAGVDADAGTYPAGLFLVGGSSRIPLLARTVHERLGVLPVSSEQPETVVARGALRALGAAPRPQDSATVTGPEVAPVAVHPTEAGRRRRWLVGTAVVLLVGGAVGAGLLWTRAPAAPALRVVAAQRASFTVPASWQESRRVDDGTSAQVDVTPDGAPARDHGLFLVQTALDPGLTQPEVAQALRRQMDVELAAGKRYAAFDAAADFAGRPVVSYRELRTGGSVVDWYVLVEAHTEVSVGCQHAGNTTVAEQPCAQAVRTVRVAGD